jgi:hypothetical protein
VRTVVSGMLAGDPHQGGATWAVLQYVLGLERLGHEVLFLEPVPASGLPAAAPYFRRVVAVYGIGAALLVEGEERTVGVPYADVREWTRNARVLLNLSGLLADEALTESIPIRVYVDLDPAFAQLWQTQGIDLGFERHTHHATVGQALGSDDCPVPTCGLGWIPTVPPVVLERWPIAGPILHDALTTVGNWRSYGSIEHEGVFYGQKAHTLRDLIELPRLANERFLLALAIHSEEAKDIRALTEAGWELRDPRTMAGTPSAYREFVSGSKAELGIAKAGYVVSRCGWFSDRSACYLASGRPVVAQDTGFGGQLPTGDGLFAFGTIEDVLVAIEDLRRDYGRHARAARALAEEHFDSDRVLTSLLSRVGAA